MKIVGPRFEDPRTREGAGPPEQDSSRLPGGSATVCRRETIGKEVVPAPTDRTGAGLADFARM
jgi:hypothetical protein